MKRIIFFLMMLFAFNSFGAETKLIKKSTNESFVISCDEELFEDCDSLTVSYTEKDGRTSSSVHPKEKVILALKNWSKLIHEDTEQILPVDEFEQLNTEVPGYFFNMTQVLWGRYLRYPGLDGKKALGVVLTPVTAAIDTVGLIAIDSALVVAYPFAYLGKTLFGKNRVNYRVGKKLAALKEGKVIKASSSTIMSFALNTSFWCSSIK